MRAVWGGASVDYDGDFTTLRGANVFPQPVQASVPIVVGGHSEAAARRAGRLGDGFFPGKGEWPTLERAMRAAATEAGRDPDAIEITRGGALDKDSVQRIADEGTDRFTIPPLAFDPAGLRDALARFADEVITKVGVSTAGGGDAAVRHDRDRIRVDPSPRPAHRGTDPRRARRRAPGRSTSAPAPAPTSRPIGGSSRSSRRRSCSPSVRPARRRPSRPSPRRCPSPTRRFDAAMARAHAAPLDRPARRDRARCAGSRRALVMFTFDTDVVPVDRRRLPARR